MGAVLKADGDKLEILELRVTELGGAAGMQGEDMRGEGELGRGRKSRGGKGEERHAQ